MEELKELRSKVFDDLTEAEKKKDDAAVAAADKLLVKIDEARQDLALLNLASFAKELTTLQEELDKAKKKATLLGGLKDLAKPPQKPG
jgi:hypothetical protein